LKWFSHVEKSRSLYVVSTRKDLDCRKNTNEETNVIEQLEKMCHRRCIKIEIKVRNNPRPGKVRV